MLKKFSFLLACFSILSGMARTQTLPVGTLQMEDDYRREQLLGTVDSTLSFAIRPLPYLLIKRDNLSLTNSSDRSARTTDTASAPKSFSFLLYPLSIKQQFNSDHPYGWNDGAMIPARGYQTLISAGFFAKYKFLSIQLNPEFVYAQNKKFRGFADAGHIDPVWNVYYYYYNHTDQPERFGNGSYSKWYTGQSNVRITFDPVSFGLSSENLWWGPGYRNSLIMSNNAPGFKYLTLNTTRPVGTPIGTFEAQVIGGRLEASGYPPLLLDNADPKNSLYVPKPKDWRYLSALVFSYHPKWISGFFLGFSRSYIIYEQNLGKGFSDYLPVLSSLGTKDYSSIPGNVYNKDKMRDQQTAFFARWYSSKTHAEVYAEYGRNDHPWNLRDLFVEPEHSRAYILGMKKVFPLNRLTGKTLEARFELTEMGKTRTAEIRGDNISWYIHHQVVDGYTNEGQVLGSGIGSGSNLQSLDLTWATPLNKLGFQLERYVHNNDFYYDAFSGANPGTIKDIRRNWVDLSVGVNASKTFRQLVINGNLTFIHSFNYEWELKDSPDPTVYWTPGRDVNHVHAQLNLLYRF